MTRRSWEVPSGNSSRPYRSITCHSTRFRTTQNPYLPSCCDGRHLSKPKPSGNKWGSPVPSCAKLPDGHQSLSERLQRSSRSTSGALPGITRGPRLQDALGFCRRRGSPTSVILWPRASSSTLLAPLRCSWMVSSSSWTFR
jgi:hypothetical protein